MLKNGIVLKVGISLQGLGISVAKFHNLRETRGRLRKCDDMVG